MTFRYNSSKFFSPRELPDNYVRDIREHLIREGFSKSWTVGELQDSLLRYRHKDGTRVLINQLEPIFTYLARRGELWPEQESQEK